MKHTLLIFCSVIALPPEQPGGAAAAAAWWERTTVYEVYPRSLQDSNGDGTGDLNGIRSRLDYFSDLGVETLWLTPIFESPMRDSGYDISNYLEIDPLFGTMEDFELLVAEAHEKGDRNAVGSIIPLRSFTELFRRTQNCPRFRPQSLK